ncbi:MFS transporter [Deinococcus yavapaiensis]|uniref:Putative MFS family arabinose efflux permease n=1 Tax=Deinococcus yavapaiensis KR-236 TaxID=694435 RepID=A0A318S5J2_9DEIO|nr:MFS transporter [Deinococcus yavapaiensis]PYE53825.1 putative MFS family arabinose efflux permease [Deinococcus yavapaiensis KR-236]
MQTRREGRSSLTRPEIARSARLAAWAVLRHGNFRLLWIGQAVSGVGTFMQVVGQSLLVLKLSHDSAVALGAVSLAQALAFFAFSLLGGGVVDRFDKRRVLFVTQSLLALLAGTLAALTATNTATLPIVVGLAFLSGVVASFDQPARSSLLPSLVPREDLPHATALNSLAMTTAGTLGPAVAGLTAATLGLAVNFGVNALGFLVVLVCLALMRLPRAPAVQKPSTPLFASVGEGLAVVARHSTLPWVVSGYGLLLLLGPSPSVILPLYAVRVLHVGGGQLGMLFLMVGAGTVLASVTQALLGAGRHSRVFVVVLSVWAMALVVFSLSSSLLVCAGALLLHGAARNVVGTTAVTMMQLFSPDSARGRVMSLNTLLVGGLRPLGDFGVSAAMAASSVEIVTTACGVLVASYALWLRGRLRSDSLGEEQP